MEVFSLLQRMKAALAAHILANKIKYLIVVFMLVAGITAGFCSENLMSEASRNDMMDYLSRFFSVLSAETPQIGKILLQAFFNHLLLYVLLTVCGLMLVGIPFNLLLVFWKAFLTGFTVAAMLHGFGFAGLMLVCFCLLPPNLLILPLRGGLGKARYLRVGYRLALLHLLRQSTQSGAQHHAYSRRNGATLPDFVGRSFDCFHSLSPPFHKA